MESQAIKPLGPEEAERMRMDVWDALTYLRATNASEWLTKRLEGAYRRLAEREQTSKHWTMREGANALAVRVVNHGPQEDIECLCGEGKRYVEGEWPIHGWTFHAGQCCNCMNIRDYSNGASPDDWESGDAERIKFADENSDEIHICDLDAFIEMLQAIKAAKEDRSHAGTVTSSCL